MVEVATDKQLSYIAKLLEKKQDVPDAVVTLATQPLSKVDASKIITQLQSYAWKPNDDWSVPGTNNGHSKPNIEAETFPKPGTYTVTLGVGHRTIRIRKPHPKANFLVAEYLYGPDNSSDFKRFARQHPGGWKFVPGFADNEASENKTANALRFLQNVDDAELKEMGFEYALKSGNCYRCGRKLTVPASIHQGMGPICAGKE